MIQITELARQARPTLSVGFLLLQGLAPKRLGPVVDGRKARAEAEVRAQVNPVDGRVAQYEAYFSSRNFSCPLPKQVQAVRSQGYPQAPALVLTLLMAETLHGVLMGVQDWDRIRPPLLWDLASRGECGSGRLGPLSCSGGEPVLRDCGGLVASYFQGPDVRTAESKTTRSALFLAFGAPGVLPAALVAALAEVKALTEGAWADCSGPTLIN